MQKSRRRKGRDSHGGQRPQMPSAYPAKTCVSRWVRPGRSGRAMKGARTPIVSGADAPLVFTLVQHQGTFANTRSRCRPHCLTSVKPWPPTCVVARAAGAARRAPEGSGGDADSYRHAACVAASAHVHDCPLLGERRPHGAGAAALARNRGVGRELAERALRRQRRERDRATWPCTGWARSPTRSTRCLAGLPPGRSAAASTSRCTTASLRTSIDRCGDLLGPRSRRARR